MHMTPVCFFSCQIPVPRTHSGPHIPEFFAPHSGGAGDGGGGSHDLECSNVPAGSDQMGLSTDIWLTPFLHVKVYHGSGSVDSPRPPGSLCSGRSPRGKSLKNNLDTLNSSLYLGKVTLEYRKTGREEGEEKTARLACWLFLAVGWVLSVRN